MLGLPLLFSILGGAVLFHFKSVMDQYDPNPDLGCS